MTVLHDDRGCHARMGSAVSRLSLFPPAKLRLVGHIPVLQSVYSGPPLGGSPLVSRADASTGRGSCRRTKAIKPIAGGRNVQ